MTVNIDNAYYNKITDKKRQAVLVRSNIERLTSQFFFDKGFIFVEPPILHEAIANKKSEIYLPMYNHCHLAMRYLWGCMHLNLIRYLLYRGASVTNVKRLII